MALSHDVSYRSVHPPVFRLLPPIDDDQKLPFLTAVGGAGHFGTAMSWVPAVPAVQLALPTHLHPSKRLHFLSLWHTEPCGQQAAGPALGVLCPGRRGSFPPSGCFPGTSHQR